MKSFDDLVRLLDSNEVFIDDKNSDMFKLSTLLKDVFKAGAQSKQAEIDELQRKYDAMYSAFTYSDDCRKEWHESFMRSKEREDELRKRIDVCEKLRDSQFDKLWNLTQAIEVARNGADEDFDLFLNYLSNILKGTTNEQ